MTVAVVLFVGAAFRNVRIEEKAMKRNVLGLILLPMLAVVMACLQVSKDLEIARRGRRSAFSIVLPDAPTESEQFAAEELRDWTAKLVGTELPIVTNQSPVQAVYLNRSRPSAEEDADRFRIVSNGSGVFVTGGSRGILYGVYELLETYGGILWLEKEFTHVPTVDVFLVPQGIDRTESPAFRMRHQSCSLNWDDHLFAARLRNNRITDEAKLGYWSEPFDQRLGNCHTFQSMVPPDKYFKSHPEYFAELKGKRTSDHGQLCLTNPDVYEIVKKFLLERIRENEMSPHLCRRMTKCYGISQDDWNGYCECTNCAAIDEREGSHAGCIIWFVNKLAEEIEKDHPNAVIQTLAYMYSRFPPRNLKPRKNVIVTLCTIECDFTKPIAKNRNPENVEFLDRITRWHDITPGGLYVWDYAANWRASPSPEPNLFALADNIRLYRDRGVVQFYAEGLHEMPNSDFRALKGWLISKLMWNPDQPVQPLIEKFCRAYYGPAADSALSYIALIHRQKIDESKKAWDYAVAVENLPYDDAFFVAAARIIDVARMNVRDCPNAAIVRNVAWMAFGLDYTRAERYAFKSGWAPFVASREVVNRLNSHEFDEMRSCARRAVEMLDRDSSAMVSSHLEDERLKMHLRAFAAAEFPKASDVTVLQDWAMTYSNHPKSTVLSRVEDASALDGKALVSNGTKKALIWCDMKGYVAFDRGATYAVRIRAKIAPKPEADPKIGLLALDVVDRTNERKNILHGVVFPSQATGVYQWYDLGTLTVPSDDCTLVVDMRESTASVDAVEFKMVKESVHRYSSLDKHERS